MVLRPSFEESVGVTFEQRHVRVHARTRVLAERLRHEGRVNALLDGNFLDDGSEGHDVVCHGQCIGVTKVNLVLTWTTFVVAELNRNSELLKHAYRATTEIVSGSTWNVVEVTGIVDRNRALRTNL